MNLFVSVLNLCQLSAPLTTFEMEFHCLTYEYAKNIPLFWTALLVSVDAHFLHVKKVQSFSAYLFHVIPIPVDLHQILSVDSTPGWRLSNFLHHMEAAPKVWSPLSLFIYSLWNGSMRITHNTVEAECTKALHRHSHVFQFVLYFSPNNS